MQIIAVGLHKDNVPEHLWKRGEESADIGREQLKRLHGANPENEFLFVDSSHTKEILAAVEDQVRAQKGIEDFFHRYLHLAEKPSHLFFHILEGPDAVRHFLQLALGMEPANVPSDEEFLQRVHESIGLANELSMAGPVLNRLYHAALMLKGKIKSNNLALDFSEIAQQVESLIRKIFGQLASANLLVIGKNNLTAPILSHLQPQGMRSVKFCHHNPSVATELAEDYSGEPIGIGELPQALLNAQVILRMNQDGCERFTAKVLRGIMTQRKNYPLLIINLDSTITPESALSRVYNLYVFDLIDFQNAREWKDAGLSSISKLVEEELKEFFSWFYSKERYRFGDIIGKSSAMERILELIARIAPTDITVLIQGESGTGKEIIARAIHESSSRREKPFIVVNCGALTETLLESELFGHVRGAFTGATFSKKGLFEEADHGTIFLDEIGDTSPALQVKLLRVLQEGEIRRVGSNEFIKINVRLIAATNRKLDELVKQGTFRQDLYYRLNVVEIDIPPLRQRPEDILPLAEHFMKKYAEKMKKRVTCFSEEATRLLLRYPWPGNVRELENAVERAVALTIGHTVQSADLPDYLRTSGLKRLEEKIRCPQMTLKELEREYILNSLEACDWQYDKVARLLDIGRTTLWRKMKEYKILKGK